MDKELEINYQKEIGAFYKDSLTGLLNHGIFQIFLEREEKRSQRYGRPFTLSFIDIDSFSLYNKRHGILKGDRMLKKIAEVIRVNTRQSDLSARYAGDVFAVIVPESDTESAFKLIEGIRNSVENLSDTSITVSGGLASFPRNGSNKSTLIYKTESALQQAKIKGKNRICLYEEKKQPLYESYPRIMIVDDEPRNLKLLEALLIPLNYNITKADNGEDALHMLSKVEVDLILLDVMMPRMDGFEVCRRLKTNPDTRMIPVILVTALDDVESKIKGIEAGADDFITKPPNKFELLARTKSLIKLKKLNHNLISIESVLFSLANTIEAKDAYTQGHIDRVSNMALELGEKMGLGSADLESLRFGGALHDIGKIGVPADILNKPGPLDPDEWEIMKQHPETGFQICQPLNKNLGVALDVIRHHHEKLDGSGYPYGLKGDEICIAARIIAVADIYDALVTDRPYRKKMSRQEAFCILRQEALEGKIDIEVVKCLIKMLSE